MANHPLLASQEQQPKQSFGRLLADIAFPGSPEGQTRRLKERELAQKQKDSELDRLENLLPFLVNSPDAFKNVVKQLTGEDIEIGGREKEFVQEMQNVSKFIDVNPQDTEGAEFLYNEFRQKFGGVKGFKERAAGIPEAIERGREVEERTQRGIARGIPQEEGAILTPEQERTEAAIAGGLTPAEVTKLGEPPKTGALKNYRLANGEVVLSDGKTFTDADGVVKPLPLGGTTLVSTTETIAGIRTSQVQGAAQEAVAGQVADEGVDPETAALGGTGPYAALKSATDRVLGGLGVDAAFGREGLFPETADNRQTLALLKQVGKPALVNNKRFPIAEQKNVDRLFADPDRFWVNPRLEARKFPKLRTFAQDGIDFNNREITKPGLTPREVTDIQANTRELNRFLNLLGPGEKAVEAASVIIMPNGERRTFDASGKRIE